VADLVKIEMLWERLKKQRGEEQEAAGD